MPTYQYRCTTCSTEVEAVQKFTDDPLTDCPECDGNLRKVFNAVGVVFKGSGFYATDNRSKGRASTSAPAAKPSEPVRPEPKAAGTAPSSTGATTAA